MILCVGQSINHTSGQMNSWEYPEGKSAVHKKHLFSHMCAYFTLFLEVTWYHFSFQWKGKFTLGLDYLYLFKLKSTRSVLFQTENQISNFKYSNDIVIALGLWKTIAWCFSFRWPNLRNSARSWFVERTANRK